MCIPENNADKACSTHAQAIKHLSASFLFLHPPAGLELSGLERFKRTEEGSVAEGLHLLCILCVILAFFFSFSHSLRKFRVLREVRSGVDKARWRDPHLHFMGEL
jgi:hypothetical protein